MHFKTDYGVFQSHLVDLDEEVKSRTPSPTPISIGPVKDRLIH